MSKRPHRSLSDSSTGSDDPPEAKRPNLIQFTGGTAEESVRAGSNESFSQGSSFRPGTDEILGRGPSSGKAREEAGNFSQVAQKMMSKMGHQVGQGLGKQGQGIVEPIKASTQKGRRGLGLPNLDAAASLSGVDYDPAKENVSSQEKVHWIKSSPLPCPTLQEMRGWIEWGPRKLDLKGETTFCDPEVLKSVLGCKNVLDTIQPNDLMRARSRSNPYESIKGVFFLNRAAVKMANIDAILDFCLTEPKTWKKNEPVVGKDELFYFSDVCAGPGGFSEYVLWRKTWRAKGFGFTLKGSHDFKLEDFYAGHAESFEPHYGDGGQDGDGDVFKETNLKAFKAFVLENTGGQGVHLMMADGGFSVEGQENVQEILSKQLYLCQFLFAMSIVRDGGHFVCKVFDLFTPFSVGLVYLLYRAFEQVSIHKPNTSRPANSERYLICKWKRENTKDIQDYMFEINMELNKLGFRQDGTCSSKQDILHIVPLNMMTEDEAFFSYMCRSNDILGNWQITGLAKIVAFAKDLTLKEARQQEMRRECLEYWDLPDNIRKAPLSGRPEEKINNLLRNASLFLSSQGTLLSPENFKASFKHSIYDWKFVVLNDSKKEQTRGFFAGTGRANVYFLSPRGKWDRVANDCKFELSPDTIVYGEIVNEMRGEGPSTKKTLAFHIIDAVFLGGEDLRDKDLQTRNKLCKTFAQAMTKNSMPEYLPIRAKDMFDLRDLKLEVFSKLKFRSVKGCGRILRATLDLQSSERASANSQANSKRSTIYGCVTGIMCFKAAREPYCLEWSRTWGRIYYFNKSDNSSRFEFPKEAILDIGTSFEGRLIWNWDEGVKLNPEADRMQEDSGKLQPHQMLALIQEKAAPQITRTSHCK